MGFVILLSHMKYQVTIMLNYGVTNITSMHGAFLFSLSHRVQPLHDTILHGERRTIHAYQLLTKDIFILLPF